MAWIITLLHSHKVFSFYSCKYSAYQTKGLNNISHYPIANLTPPFVNAENEDVWNLKFKSNAAVWGNVLLCKLFYFLDLPSFISDWTLRIKIIQKFVIHKVNGCLMRDRSKNFLFTIFITYALHLVLPGYNFTLLTCSFKEQRMKDVRIFITEIISTTTAYIWNVFWNEVKRCLCFLENSRRNQLQTDTKQVFHLMFLLSGIS